MKSNKKIKKRKNKLEKMKIKKIIGSTKITKKNLT